MTHTISEDKDEIFIENVSEEINAVFTDANGKTDILQAVSASLWLIWLYISQIDDENEALNATDKMLQEVNRRPITCNTSFQRRIHKNKNVDIDIYTGVLASHKMLSLIDNYINPFGFHLPQKTNLEKRKLVAFSAARFLSTKRGYESGYVQPDVMLSTVANHLREKTIYRLKNGEKDPKQGTTPVKVEPYEYEGALTLEPGQLPSTKDWCIAIGSMVPQTGIDFHFNTIIKSRDIKKIRNTFSSVAKKHGVSLNVERWKKLFSKRCFHFHCTCILFSGVKDTFFISFGEYCLSLTTINPYVLAASNNSTEASDFFITLMKELSTLLGTDFYGCIESNIEIIDYNRKDNVLSLASDNGPPMKLGDKELSCMMPNPKNLTIPKQKH